MFGIRRGDLPEPPPEGYAQLGLRPGYTLHHLPSDAAVDAYCRAAGVGPNADYWNPYQISACVVPSRHELVIPQPGVHDATWDKAIEDHEDAHTWGLIHGGAGARGWQTQTGEKPPVVTPQMAQTMLAVAQVQAQQQAAPPFGSNFGFSVPPQGSTPAK